jgi:phenylacetate 2-hydroxylase
VSEAPGVYTLATSPRNDSVKKARNAAATALNRQAMLTYLPLIDLGSTTSINELMQNIKNGESDINPDGYFQRFSLNADSRTSGSASPAVNSD